MSSFQENYLSSIWSTCKGIVFDLYQPKLVSLGNHQCRPQYC